MKALVVYYSRTGTTKKVAEVISKALDSDIEEVIDMKDRRGAKGYVIAGKDAATKQLTEIKNSKKDISLYGIVIIGTPVWAFTMAPAIRTYLTENKSAFKKIVFFCTQGGAGSKGTFKNMEEVCGKKPYDLFEATTKEVQKGSYIANVKKFIEQVAIAK